MGSPPPSVSLTLSSGLASLPSIFRCPACSMHACLLVFWSQRVEESADGQYSGCWRRTPNCASVQRQTSRLLPGWHQTVTRATAYNLNSFLNMRIPIQMIQGAEDSSLNNDQIVAKSQPFWNSESRHKNMSKYVTLNEMYMQAIHAP